MAIDDAVPNNAAFQQKMRQFKEQAARAAQLKDRLGELKGSARNSDGSVTVTVAPSGAILGLQLSPAAMTRTHTQLTQEILSTIRQATQQAAAMTEEIVRPAIGDEGFERFQEAFRAHAPAVNPIGPSEPPPASSLPIPGAPPAMQPRPRPSHDDDDYDGFQGIKR
ncbi:YbaB/EbfC family nucleoid-associated protein [Kibdelosporangium philippinense]|uniref:YbaB/EbfC family nucleoid-associated protein n=1 Tax=Kibdelosporangium philippinense TaxID=211113 RepID=A0ABS8ZA76_9PSEU|nr:YbaB/EbfC family nucleoid-associated protein [Kibdelosporangium philippinense]MCE7003943.1 YbaB/EbfC family nucleoid-associated protein [Kibdelosporangium philippinense]